MRFGIAAPVLARLMSLWARSTWLKWSGSCLWTVDYSRATNTTACCSLALLREDTWPLRTSCSTPCEKWRDSIFMAVYSPRTVQTARRLLWAGFVRVSLRQQGKPALQAFPFVFRQESFQRRTGARKKFRRGRRKDNWNALPEIKPRPLPVQSSFPRPSPTTQTNFTWNGTPATRQVRQLAIKTDLCFGSQREIFLKRNMVHFCSLLFVHAILPRSQALSSWGRKSFFA